MLISCVKETQSLLASPPYRVPNLLRDLCDIGMRLHAPGLDVQLTYMYNFHLGSKGSQSQLAAGGAVLCGGFIFILFIGSILFSPFMVPWVGR
jgi:hypothetical protein